MEKNTTEAESKRDTIQCKSCMQKILVGATVCYKCGRHQGAVWRFLNRLVPLISLAGVIFLGFQVYITSQQILIAKELTNEAKAKRIEAETVLKEVKQVKAKADEILIDTENKVVQLDGEVDSVEDKLVQTDKRLASTEKRFIGKQEALSKDVTALKGELSVEIKKLKARNELTQLADLAKYRGIAAAYDELKSKRIKSMGTELYDAVTSEILSIKRFYLGITRMKNIHLTRNGVKVEPTVLTTGELRQQLLNNQVWSVRALVAKELGNRKETEVPEVLIKCAESDTRLDVRRD
jgi:hypothetical protein